METIMDEDIVCGCDGFYIFWPEGCRGGFTSNDLRYIADKLDEMNSTWEAQIKEYFNG